MDRYDPWLEKLSAYLDDDLAPAERAALEAHLAECVACREALGEIRAVIALAGQLDDRAPEHDLWPGIRARIGAAGGGTQVPPVTRGAEAGISASPAADASGVFPFRAMTGGEQRQAPRRLSFSLPQLAAACIALMLLGGGAVWLLGPGNMPPGEMAAGHPMAVAPASTTNGPAVNGPATTHFASDPASGLAGQQYDAAIADLERILAEGRGQLAPATIEVLENNLAIIDQAIEEARSAIAEDPANLYLANYLTDTMRRKLELLRYTNSIVRAQS